MSVQQVFSEHPLCASWAWYGGKAAHGAAVPTLRRCPGPKEGTGHLAENCLLIPKGILHAQYNAWLWGDNKHSFTFLCFPDFTNLLTLP